MRLPTAKAKGTLAKAKGTLAKAKGLVRGEPEARPAGFEPATFGFEVRDSIR